MTTRFDVRSASYGQSRSPTSVDRFGVWLSTRQIRRWVPSFRHLRVGDFGCGYHASFSRTILDEIKEVVLVDVALSEDLAKHEKVKAITGVLPAALEGIPSGSLDVVICMSVLEHLWEPLAALEEFGRILAPGGVCLVNVPSWRGKWFLELSAFRLHLSPEEEMDDHKMYYDPQDLWPLLVRAGFKPSLIRCFSHKCGLNTFACCRTSK